MATQYAEISDRFRSFIEEQHIFFVATAARDGRVNVSPKGLDSLRVLNPNRVVWLNGTGSGNETAAHLLDVPRMTLMFCSFTRSPVVLRLYGEARAIHERDEEWEDLLGLFPPMRGARNIFDLRVDLVQKSCGYGVPLFDFQEDRTLMDSWAAKKKGDELETYQREKNQRSIDDFPTALFDD